MTEPNDTIENKVIAFVAEETSALRDEIGPATELGRDIGMDGDEAEEFMKAFQAAFDVDMQDFEFSRHFGPEAPFSLIWYVFMLVFHRHSLKFEPIAVSDLVRAAREKRWPAERRPTSFPWT
jgi:acyl carrier protein